jgi:peptidoglycan/xylan/chitin deacetylase (PgdA/CDA1 family)
MSLAGALAPLMRSVRRPLPLILMYHRIAKVALDPWALAVSPCRFGEQLEVLRRIRHPLRLEDFVARFHAGRLPANAVAVTFDDGYVDNLLAGKPLLCAAGVPATVFLPTGYLGRSGEFWWDEFARLILAGEAVRAPELEGKGISFNLMREPSTPEDRGWRYPCEPRTTRQNALLTIRRQLRALGDTELLRAMAAIRSCFTDITDHQDRGRPMTVAEVEDLIQGGLITIGPHTVTHPALTDLDVAAAGEEIRASKAVCESLFGSTMCTFAYPYGEFNLDIRQAVETIGLSAACSTYGGPVHPLSDPLALPRIQVLDWDGEDFAAALMRYGTCD